MKRLLPSLLLAVCSYTAAGAAAPVPLLYGYVAEAEADRPVGLYTITPTADPVFTPVSDKITANYGADFIGDTYYCVKVYPSWSGGENVDIEQYNADTWVRSKFVYGKQRNKATDLAYDPTTQTTYGCFYTNDGQGYEYATMDFATATRNAGTALGTPYNAVAVDADGTLYAIDMNGYLYKALDKEKGIMSAIGNTGVVPRDITSGCIDRRSGRFFWTVRNADGAFIYEVNKTTGAATMIARLPHGERITGLCVRTPAVDDDAPGNISGLTADFAAGSLSGKVRFTMPSSTFAGEPLTGTLSYKVTDGSSTLAEGTAQAGAQAVADVTVARAGKYELAVNASNAAGAGAAAKIKLYIGPDTPVAPAPAAAWTGSKVTVSWPAVTEGVNGGYVAPDALTYKVVRKQDSKVVADNLSATSADDNVDWPAQITVYNYTVTASCAGLTSAAATTGKVVLGEIVPPVEETFDAMSSIDAYTIISDRTYSWTVAGKTAQVSGNAQMDDWLVTPPIRLEAGKVYEFAIDARCYSSYAERFEVMVGTAPTAAAMTTAVIPPTDVTKNTMTTFTGRITAPADGLFYIGIHSISADPFTLYVDNLILGAGAMPAAPAAPADLTAKAAADGARRVELSFTAPTFDINGGALPAITKAELYCGDKLIHTFEAPAAGSKLAYTHTDAPAGAVTYSAVAYNGSAKGRAAETQVFVGFNKPLAPEGVTAAESDGKVTLSWKAPAADIDGKPLPADRVTYTIYTRDADGSAVVVSDDIAALSHTWQAVDEGQRYIYLAVTAVSEGGRSDASDAVYIPAGKAYDAPYRESFAGGAPAHIHGITRLSGECSWTVFDDSRMQGIPSCDGDDGFLAMVGNDAGDAAEIATGKISLAGLSAPALAFHAFNYVSGDLSDDNTVDVLVDAGAGFEPVGHTVLSSLGSHGWHRVVTDLSAYAGKTVIVKLRGTIVTYPQTHIDNIRVLPMHASNLSVSVSGAPARVKANTGFELTAGVENTGTGAMTAYTVDFYAGEEKVASADGRALQPGAHASHTVTVSPGVAHAPEVTYTAVVSHPDDAYAADNTAATRAVTVYTPGYAVPTGLSGQSSAEGNILSWTAPDPAESLPQTATEDFESFDSFGTVGQNGWTFADVDGGIVSGILGFDLPGLPAPGTGTLSWFTLDSGWSGFIGNAYKAADGRKYLSNMCLYGDDTVDDRAISPELYGGAQTISLLARSFSAEYPETLTVMASQSGTAAGDFTTVATFGRLSSRWTEYHVDLPEGTRHFALCATSTDAFMLHIDRVEFIPAGAPETLVLTGYNVYRDGRRVNTPTVTDPTYTDAAPDGLHTYSVSAVYDKGESALSEAIDLASAGINSATAAAVTVEGGHGHIVVRGACGLETMVVTVDGRVAAGRRVASDYERIELAAGIYIVRAGASTAKVVVQ